MEVNRIKRRKIAILLILICFFLPEIKAQQRTLNGNLDIYWYYRERLKKNFVAIDPNNGWGTNLCSGRRHMDNRGSKKIGWGDATITHGFYLGVLATEYRLLKNNGEDVTDTRDQLFYALQAIERLDYWAEHHWSGSASLNGFFVRDDIVPGGNDNPNCILHPSRSQLGADDGLGGQVTEALSDFEHTNGKPREMSKDQVWHLLLGLALVEELVDDETLYLSAYGAHYDHGNQPMPLNYYARLITHRIIKYMQGDDDQKWTITNPANNDEIVATPGAAYIREPWISDDLGNWQEPTQAAIYSILPLIDLPLSIFVNQVMDQKFWYDYAFAEAGNSITHKGAGAVGNLPGFSDLHFKGSDNNQGRFNATTRLRKNTHKVISCYNLITIFGSGSGKHLYLSNKTYYEYLKWRTITEDNGKKYEHLRLIFTLLHPDKNDIHYRSDYQQMSSYGHILDLLNTAPECGPYNFYNANNSNIEDWGHYNWSSPNRLYEPHLLGKAVHSIEPGNEKQVQGYYSGLDYMLLHNLFLLTYHNFNQGISGEYPEFVNQKGDPPPCSGCLENPTHRHYQRIETDANVTQEEGHFGDVTMSADVRVLLKPGFKVEKGAHFRADVAPAGDALDYRITDWTPSGGCNSKGANPNEDSAPKNEIEETLEVAETEADEMFAVAELEPETYTYETSKNINSTDNAELTEKDVQEKKTEMLKPEYLVYPNPTSGEFIVMTNNLQNQSKYLLYTNFGKLVRRETSDQQMVYFDIRQLQSGMYYLKVIHKTGTETFKIVKE